MSRDDLVRAAEENGAPEEVLESLRGMTDREYDSPTAVSSTVTGND